MIFHSYVSLPEGNHTEPCWTGVKHVKLEHKTIIRPNHHFLFEWNLSISGQVATAPSTQMSSWWKWEFSAHEFSELWKALIIPNTLGSMSNLIGWNCPNLPQIHIMRWHPKMRRPCTCLMPSQSRSCRVETWPQALVRHRKRVPLQILSKYIYIYIYIYLSIYIYIYIYVCVCMYMDPDGGFLKLGYPKPLVPQTLVSPFKMTNFGCLSLWKRPKFGPMDSRCLFQEGVPKRIKLNINYYCNYCQYASLHAKSSQITSFIAVNFELCNDAQRPTRNVGASHADTGLRTMV